MVEGMVTRKSLKELNPGTIDITKVLILPRKDERIEDYYVFMGGKCTKTRSYTETSNSKDNVVGRLDSFPFFPKVFI
jgi:hypothetical protein